MADDKNVAIDSDTEPKQENEQTPRVDAEGRAEAEKSDPIAVMEAKLAAAEHKAEENYDRLLRVSAEFENFKKRSAREQADVRKYATERLIKELLTVVDNLERAIDSADNEVPGSNGLIEGVVMTHKEILKIFEKYEVKPVEALGKAFDPTFHQAVMQQEDEKQPENTVIQELQKGYLMHDRLIRPAMVVVSKGKASNEQTAEND